MREESKGAKASLQQFFRRQIDIKEGDSLMTDPTLEDEKESQEDSGKNQGVRLLQVDSPGKYASLKRKSVKRRSPTKADLEDGSSFAEDRDSE